MGARKSRKATASDEETPQRGRFLKKATGLAALGLSSLIAYNAFFGAHGDFRRNSTGQKLSGTTKVAVSAAQNTNRTITLRYDELVEDVQRELLATGHFNGLVDGVDGPKTQAAIEHYQRQNKLEVTGKVSKGLLEHIRYTQKLNQAAEFTGSLEPVSDIAPKANKPIVKAKKKVVAEAKSTKAKKPERDDQTLAVQKKLIRLGYGPVPTTGTLDDTTRAAILKFALDHGLPMDGEVNRALIVALSTAELQQASQ